jgi:hypothetical protein
MVVFQQGVEANGVVSGQMAIDRCIAEWQQLPVLAIAAGHPRFFADALPPPIGAGRGISERPLLVLCQRRA